MLRPAVQSTAELENSGRYTETAKLTAVAANAENVQRC